MKKGMRVGIWMFILAMVIILFVLTALRRLQKEDVQSIADVQKAEGIPVDIVRVQSVAVEDWRGFSGVAEGCEQVNLVAPFRTRVVAVRAKIGEAVSAGKVLLSLDPYDPAHFGMNLKTVQAQYETAREDSSRLEELLKSGAVSRQEVDHVRAATRAARAQYLTARRAVELDTPISGIVTAVNILQGEYAASEEILATVSSYDRIRISLEVSEADRALIAVGQPVRLRFQAPSQADPGQKSDSLSAGPSAYLRGEVTKVTLSADSATRLFFVEVMVNNPDHVLRPGTLVTPEVLVAASPDRPAVPRSALVTQDQRVFVYVIEGTGTEGMARLRPVRQGIEDRLRSVVEDGVLIGEQVVVQGQNQLEEGVKVRIHADRTAEYYGRSL